MSEFCRPHHEASIEKNKTVYAIYKRRRVVEAAAVADAHGRLEELEHTVFRERPAEKMPRVHLAGPLENRWEVVASVLDGDWKDDLFDRLMEFLPRRLVPEVSGKTDIEPVIKALSPVAQEINTAISRRSVFRKYCDGSNGWRFASHLPGIDVTTLFGKQRATSLSTREDVYLLCGVMTVDRHDCESCRYAWTLPVDYVDQWDGIIRPEKVLRFEVVR